MNEPLISIGIPTYNRPKSLRRAITSVINQTYRNLEIIISDNCSTDEEVGVVMREFQFDGRIKFFRQRVNKGAIYNFNFILDKFSGSYFMRLGDDDWLDENYVELCLSYLIENSDFVCAYGKTKLHSIDNGFVKFDDDFDLIDDFYSNRMSSYYQLVVQNGLFFGLMKRDCLPFVINKKKLADDWIAIARVCFIGKIKLIEQTSLNMSQGGTGRSIESIVNALGLSKFNSCFPYFSICIYAYKDILYQNELYKRIGQLERIKLAKSCALTIFRRFRVSSEIKGAYKLYIRKLIQ